MGETDYQDQESQIESLQEDLTVAKQQIQNMAQREADLERQNTDLRDDYNQKIQDMSSSTDVSSMLTQELQRAQTESHGKTQEIEILKKSLQKEQQKNQRLSEKLESTTTSQKKAETELKIRRQTS